MTSMFKPATKAKAKLRMAIAGPAGSGKTFSALRIATALGSKVAVIDTEGGEAGSANKYADKFTFDHLSLTNFHPQNFQDAIRAAEAAEYDVLVIDSLSHAWTGIGGVLDQADAIAKRMRSGNSFAAWKEASPMQKALIDCILMSKVHVICTMRSKMDYIMEREEGKGGRMHTVIKKVGMAPVQRDDVPYEFDIFGDMDDGTMVISKTRCSELTDAVIKHPGEDLAKQLGGWLSDGVEPEPVMEDISPSAEAAARADVALSLKNEDGTPVKPEPQQEDATAPQRAQPEGEQQETKPFWNEKVASKLGFSRGALQKRLREALNDGTIKFDVDNTRAFLIGKYDTSSHKDMNKEMYDELIDWMRRCHTVGKVVDY